MITKYRAVLQSLSSTLALEDMPLSLDARTEPCPVVPPNVGEVHANYLFGDGTDKAIDHLMSPRNGLPIFLLYQELLGSARIAIILMDLGINYMINWKVVVLDPTLLEEEQRRNAPGWWDIIHSYLDTIPM
ncbi:uncharacterized protein F4807DRAFT_465782 [Annulohypoxylon truncatum]|uniref:uncharacterized protein n=1 Tax=Annulohypoxylon truncatum TaxID=327061 RepID=UPI0020082826|nr:uncharacterized protein F4807DRAFT_465782 [Annulohypoxylon truncatum]KAI1204336.1 hypothetical protein F4807DRAFT_465782 [Annulohypoxylon truncatum]